MGLLRSCKSKDGKTVKYLQKTDDGHVVETGYYNLDEHIVCISSQIGCLMGCIFCATAKPVDSQNPNKIFIRNLTSDEIVRQVKNILSDFPKSELVSKRILFSFMGMGEPFLNYKNVVDSIKVLSDEFSNSRTTVSTLGIMPSLIKQLAHEKIDTVLKLHLSLHAPNDELRKRILPKAQMIQPTLDALAYFTSVKGVAAKVNYILIRNINDSQQHAIQLAALLKNYPFIVKLSSLNHFNNLETSGAVAFDVFERVLNSAGIKTCRFISTGTDIGAGCGQLRRHYYEN